MTTHATYREFLIVNIEPSLASDDTFGIRTDNCQTVYETAPTVGDAMTLIDNIIAELF